MEGQDFPGGHPPYGVPPPLPGSSLYTGQPWTPLMPQWGMPMPTPPPGFAGPPPMFGGFGPWHGAPPVYYNHLVSPFQF